MNEGTLYYEGFFAEFTRLYIEFETRQEGLNHTHLVRGGSLMLQPTETPREPRFLHTHLVRGVSLMLQPTETPREPRFLHTHLVRGGSVTLLAYWGMRPADRRSRLQHQRPTSHEVGMCKTSMRASQ